MLFTATFTFFALVAIFPCTFLFRVVLSQKAVFLPRLIFFSFSFLFSLSRWPCFSTSSRRPQLLRVRETAALAAKKQRSRHCSKWPTCRLSARPLAPRPAEASRFSCARGNWPPKLATPTSPVACFAKVLAMDDANAEAKQRLAQLHGDVAMTLYWEGVAANKRGEFAVAEVQLLSPFHLMCDLPPPSPLKNKIRRELRKHEVPLDNFYFFFSQRHTCARH